MSSDKNHLRLVRQEGEDNRDDHRVKAMEDVIYRAALEGDWRAALVWLRAHPQTAAQYETTGPKWRFSWDTDA